MIKLVYAATLPAEMITLFAYWTWSRRQRSTFWLVSAVCLSLGIAAVLLLAPNPFPNRLYAAYPGMFVFSWLTWAWWMESCNPDDWTFREAAMAVLAAVAFAISRSAI